MLAFTAVMADQENFIWVLRLKVKYRSVYNRPNHYREKGREHKPFQSLKMITCLDNFVLVTPTVIRIGAPLFYTTYYTAERRVEKVIRKRGISNFFENFLM